MSSFVKIWILPRSFRSNSRTYSTVLLRSLQIEQFTNASKQGCIIQGTHLFEKHDSPFRKCNLIEQFSYYLEYLSSNPPPLFQRWSWKAEIISNFPREANLFENVSIMLSVHVLTLFVMNASCFLHVRKMKFSWYLVPVDKFAQHRSRV